MSRNSHLRNPKDFNLNKSFAEWNMNRANEAAEILIDESTDGYWDGEVSHCCEASIYNPSDDGWGMCSHCHEMAEVLNVADFE